MDFTKLAGVIDAIEAESKMPSPSHQNLARLTGMALNEVKYVVQSLFLACKAVETPVSVALSDTSNTSTNAGEVKVELAPKKPRRKLKNS